MKRKIISVILCSLMLAAVTVFSSSALSLGDIDDNGRVSAADARAILRHTASLEFLSDEQKKFADINGDGKVTASDARIVLRIGASIESLSEYEKTETETKTDSANTENPIENIYGTLSPREVYKKASEFTVEVNTYNAGGSQIGVGSGFFMSSDGVVVTNYHVIGNASSVKIKDNSGKLYNVTSVLGYDSAKDIAILGTDAKNTKSCIMSDKTVQTADSVYVMGSSVGLTGTFTNGIVSTAERVLEEMSNGVRYIQITAPITSGNSGGPVLDIYGEVVGIATMSYSSAQNLNFSIPVSYVRSVDISSPCSFADFHNKVNSEAAFSGELTLSTKGVAIEKGGTAVIYVMTANSGGREIICRSNNNVVKAYTGEDYGDLTVVYVSALDASGSADVKIFFDGYEQSSKTLSVTVGGSGVSDYYGIAEKVPDFGVYSGIAPESYIEGTSNGRSFYSFYYGFDELNAAGLDRERCLSEYISVIQSNGYRYAATADDNSALCFKSATAGTTVIFGFAEIEGEYYMYVLIYY